MKPTNQTTPPIHRTRRKRFTWIITETMEFKQFKEAIEGLWFTLTNQSSDGKFKWIQDFEWNYTKIQVRHDNEVRLETNNATMYFYLDKCYISESEWFISIISNKEDTDEQWAFIQFRNLSK